MSARLASLAPALLPALPALALFVYWIADDGGYAPTDWYPGVFAIGGLLGVALIALGPRRPVVPRPLGIALAALAAYTTWSYLSVAWAAAPGVALEGANRTLLFLLVFALFAALPWDGRAALAALGAFVFAVGAVAFVTAVEIGTAADAASRFLDGRLQAPLGYHNADAALWTMAAVPAVVLASRRGLGAGWRAVFLATAGACVELAVLTQSRGWLITLPLVLVAVFAVAPGRVRLGITVLLLGLGVLAALPELLDVYQAGGGRQGTADPEVVREAEGAMRAILWSSAALLVAGLLLGLADRRVELSSHTRAVIRRFAAIGVALALVAGAVAGLAAVDGDPPGRIDRAWEDFKANDLPAAGAGSRFGALGSSRYDFWRVALELTGDHPLAGLGQDNYEVEYLERRESGEETRWVHSLPLRLTVHTGIVGLLLFGGFCIAVAIAALSRRVRSAERALAAALLGPLVVWLAHGSVEWLWEFPGLSAPALAFAAVAASLRRPAATARRSRSAAVPRAAAAAAIVASAAAVVAAGGPYLSERSMQRALDAPRDDLGPALDRLDDAASFNPLAARPSLVAGLIAADAGRGDLAARELRHSLERQDRQWFAHFELALVASESRDAATARAELLRARELNPLEPVVRRALRRLRTRRPLSRAEAHEELLNRARLRVGLPPRSIRG